MKPRSSILLALIILTSLLLPSVNAQNKYDKSKVRISWDVDKLKLYHHQPALITLYLWTPEMQVQGISEMTRARLDKGKFSMLTHAEFDHSMNIVDKNGTKWYVYPIDCYAVAMDKAGKYQLKGGKYAVDLGIPVVYDDPFWGRMQTLQRERVEVPVAPLEINVASLPDNKFDSEFSGAVGDFNVDVSVPPGDIYLNEDAVAVITVSGPGWIQDNILPEYREAFGQGTKLKSFTENRRQYVKDGKVISELQLECTFIPTSRDNAVIGPVKIEYFNPETGSYESAVSGKVPVKVQSIAGKAPIHDI